MRVPVACGEFAVTGRQGKVMTEQRWRRIGLLFDPQEHHSWFASHAALPSLWRQCGKSCRVYFSGRDRENRAQIGYFDFDPANPSTITALSAFPVIHCGDLGAFDDSGTTSSCVVENEGLLYQYYTGWNRGVTVPFYYGVGLAVSDDGGTSFRKVSAAPILGRNAIDPYLCASPSVLIEDGLWRMWYVSGVRWVLENEQPKHYYHIKYAESRNGIEWRPTGKVSIDFKSPDEYAIARPCVLRESGTYRMWYCYRGTKYRIGYAESRDGLDWERKDEEACINTSTAGWDSEELAYPFVFRMNDELWMLYNGNGYGRTGIGIAVLREKADGDT